MLTDKFVDTIIKPFLDRQHKINNLTVEVISKRLRELKTLKKADLQSLTIIEQDTNNINYIKSKLSELTALQMDELQKLTKKTAKTEYKSKQPYYEYSGTAYPPYEENEELTLIEYAIILYAMDELEKYFRNMVYEIKDVANPLIIRYLSPADAYNTIINMGKQNIYNGQDVFSYNVSKAFVDINNKGLHTQIISNDGTATYKSLDRLVENLAYDTAVQTSNQINEVTGQQFNGDGVELSVHAFPAPDHAPIQGHTFTNEEYEKLQNNEEFEDVLGNKFQALERVIGQWNCRHFEMSVLLDVFTANYTPEQLQDILDRNERGYTYTDNRGTHHLTMYECTQRRNNYENTIKKYRQALQNAQLAGDTSLINRYNIKLNNAINIYKGFCSNCGLATRFNKTVI